MLVSSSLNFIFNIKVWLHIGYYDTIQYYLQTEQSFPQFQLPEKTIAYYRTR